jgi:hypothetical protein
MLLRQAKVRAYCGISLTGMEDTELTETAILSFSHRTIFILDSNRSRVCGL